MKKLIAYSFAVAFVVFTFTGCKKDDGGVEVYASGQGRFTGIPSTGSAFDVSGASAVFTRTVTGTQTAIIIAGVLSTSPVKSAGIGLSNITAPGTYPLLSASSTATQGGFVTYTPGSASTDSYVSLATSTAVGPGTITITTLTATNIEGTYSTKMTNSANAVITMTGTFKGTF